jgi:hypothetical protein
LPTVLAYHRCSLELETAQELLGGSAFRPSAKDYDWLGEGSYFWENIAMAENTGSPIPKNVDPAKDLTGNRILRRLDCAVMNYLFEIQKTAQETDPNGQSFLTVRALFPEGDELYPNAGFWEKTHIQICVREPERVLGVFRIPVWQRQELEMPFLYGRS